MLHMISATMGYDLSVSSYQWILAATFLLPILTIPVFSVWSDAIGRRPFIILALGGKVLEAIVTALADSIEVLTVAQVIGAITNCALVCFMAYVADLTTSKDRPYMFAALTAVWAMGSAAGSGLSVFARANFGAVSLYANAFITLIIIAVTYVRLPESLRKENRTSMN